MVNFCEILKNLNLRSNRVTKKINFNRAKICRNCQSKEVKCDILDGLKTLCVATRQITFKIGQKLVKKEPKMEN